MAIFSAMELGAIEIETMEIDDMEMNGVDHEKSLLKS